MIAVLAGDQEEFRRRVQQIGEVRGPSCRFVCFPSYASSPWFEAEEVVDSCFLVDSPLIPVFGFGIDKLDDAGRWPRLP